MFPADSKIKALLGSPGLLGKGGEDSVDCIRQWWQEELAERISFGSLVQKPQVHLRRWAMGRLGGGPVVLWKNWTIVAASSSKCDVILWSLERKKKLGMSVRVRNIDKEFGSTGLFSQYAYVWKLDRPKWHLASRSHTFYCTFLLPAMLHFVLLEVGFHWACHKRLSNEVSCTGLQGSEAGTWFSGRDCGLILNK